MQGTSILDRRSLDVATFFGTQNLISGHATGDRFTASFGEVRLPAAFDMRSAKLVVRQEAIEIGTTGVNGFVGTVEEAEYLGTHATAAVRLGADLLRVNTAPHEILEVGRPIGLTLPPERLWVIDDDGARQ